MRTFSQKQPRKSLEKTAIGGAKKCEKPMANLENNMDPQYLFPKKKRRPKRGAEYMKKIRAMRTADDRFQTCTKTYKEKTVFFI
jgi:hypothetical protein